jgi:zinc protease
MRPRSAPRALTLALVLALLAVLGLATHAHAAADTPAAREVTLSNGMRLLLQEDHSKPVIGACLFVNGGSRTESSGISGLSHYYEHLIFRGGSKEQAELEFRREMQRIGDESGGYTTNDYTCYGFTAPTNHFDEALRRSVDAWMNLKLTEAKVARERQVVMEEYHQGQDRPDYQVYYQIERLMFRDHAYKRSTIGLKEVLETATLPTFRTFYAERYVPNQMVLAVVGDFDAAAMQSKLAKAFAPYKRGRDDFELGKTESPQREFRMGAQSMKTPNTWMHLGFHAPPYAHPDAPALQVLAAVLGKGTSSRFYHALKDKENLVSTIDADFEVRRDPGVFVVGAQMPPQNEARVFGIVRDELKRIAEVPVPAAELDRVKSSLLHAYSMDAQTLFSRAERLCLFELMSDVTMEPQWPRLLASVTAQDLQRVAARYLAADLASYSVVRPEGTTGPSQAEIEALLAPWRAGWPALASARAAGTGAARKETLSNGVTLLLQEDHSVPVVAMQAMARGGQWIEPEGLAGVSNMAAVLMRRGASGMTAQQISDRASALGMRLATSGGADYAAVTAQTPSENFEKSWEIFRDVVTRPSFAANEVAKAREDLVRQAKSLGDRPFEYTNLQFAKALYKNSPYKNPLTGDEETLARIKVADLRRAYEAMFCGENLVVAIVGDFDSEKTLALARKGLGAMRRGAPVAVGQAKDTPAAEKRPITVDKDQEQITYNTGWLACSIRDPDYIPLRAAVSLIGDKLFFKYVYEKGVAYRSWFYMRDRMGQGSAQNEMGVAPSNFAMASSGVLEDVAATVRGPLTRTDLSRSTDKILSRWYLDAQLAEEVADRLSYFEAAGLGYQYADRYPELLQNLTPDEVLAVARKYLKPDTWTRVAVGKNSGKGGAPAALPGK